MNSHIHVSLRDTNGKSLFAVPESEAKSGRSDAANEETRFISQEAEWFLAGVLDGLPDSTFYKPSFEWTLKLTISYSHALGVSQKVIQYIPSLAHQHHFIACAHD